MKNTTDSMLCMTVVDSRGKKHALWGQGPMLLDKSVWTIKVSYEKGQAN